MASRGTYPVPPPYVQLYEADWREHPDLATPPPPVLPPASFFKFGEAQTGTYYQHELPLLPGQDGPHRCPQLYSQDAEGKIEFAKELRKLIWNSLDKYVELLGCLMVVKENQVEHKVNELSHIFFNITHLLNLLRPHQARQTLIAMMSRQIKQRNERAQALEQLALEAKTFLTQHGVEFKENDTQPTHATATTITTVDAAATVTTAANGKEETIGDADMGLAPPVVISVRPSPELAAFNDTLAKLNDIHDEGDD